MHLHLNDWLQHILDIDFYSTPIHIFHGKSFWLCSIYSTQIKRHCSSTVIWNRLFTIYFNLRFRTLASCFLSIGCPQILIHHIPQAQCIVSYHRYSLQSSWCVHLSSLVPLSTNVRFLFRMLCHRTDQTDPQEDLVLHNVDSIHADSKKNSSPSWGDEADYQSHHMTYLLK